jgi:hypothetical protein
MKLRFLLHGALVTLGVLAWLVGAEAPARAVPSFARQTGVSCEACHTSYPELTPFGRMFKLNGYVMTVEPQIGAGTQNLSINQQLPISAMVVVSYSQLAKADFDRTEASPTSACGGSDPDGNPLPDCGGLSNVRNNNESVLFPQQFSLFYAGRITPNMGTFLQVTFDGTENSFTMDNTDIRWADSTSLGGSRLVYGLTLNNNPTVQDLWNTTPAWGFPFSSSALTPGSVASIALDGGLAQQVAGLGAYAGWQKDAWLYYAELTAYKSAFLGVAPPISTASQQNVIQDLAPYIRLAAERSFESAAWEIGALSLDATYVPYADVQTAINSGTTITSLPTNRVSDTGFDTQFQYLDSDDQFTLKAISLHEDNKWGSLSAQHHIKATTSLDTQRVTAGYIRSHKYGVIAQSFSTTGTKDYETRTGAPDTSGSIVELIYTPYLNTRFSLSYTMFDKFNGSSSNYDGNGRNAADNNTLYLVGWLMF